MKRIAGVLAAIALIALLVSRFGSPKPEERTTNLLTAPWSAVEKEARGQEVNWAVWGGSEDINKWIDTFVVPRVKELYGVTLKRLPVGDPVETVNKLLGEKKAGVTVGTTDLMWVNGENFKALKNAELLWGPFTPQLPSFQKNCDPASTDLLNDFGTPVEGLESPYGRAQFVFVYDSAKVEKPPTSFAALLAWAKAHPGKFTYPAPPDFTGSAFIRQALYETTGGWQQYAGKYDETLLKQKTGALWDYLKALKPYLWRAGATYPENAAKLNQLYADGEVWLTMGYSPTTAEAPVRNGTYPATTRTWVMDQGTIANTHFVAIPRSAPSKAGAMAVANFLLSVEAQLSKAQPEIWGDFPALDVARLSAADKAAFAAVKFGPATLPVETLASHRVPELPPEYVGKLEEGWAQSVAKAP